MEKLFFSQIRPYFGACISLVYGLILFMWGPIDPTIEWVFVGILMFLLGIPHGAGDHLIVQKRKEMQGLPFSFIHFIISYLGVMGLYAIVWYFLPRFAFVLFILISVFHFGDLEEKEAGEESIGTLLRKLCLGTGILGWILYVHYPEVRVILGDELGTLPVRVPGYLPLLIGGSLLLGFRPSEKTRFSNTLLTLILGSFMPILPAFVCYFAGCHAVYSLRDMSAHLHLAVKSLLIKLLPFSCLAFILGFLYMRFIGSSQVIFHGFVFLSLLTMPHFWLMHQFVKKK
jgi:Brp/Blh family beta-carotene 15,15'-monooxygenase